MTHDALRRAIDSRSAKVGIIGLGYVGLPLACLFAEKGFPTTGFDIDRADRGERRLRRPARHGAIICVPTPLNKYREPDL